eukprot:9730340-Ditylum_brightwellii.AAC.1
MKSQKVCPPYKNDPDMDLQQISNLYLIPVENVLGISCSNEDLFFTTIFVALNNNIAQYLSTATSSYEHKYSPYRGDEYWKIMQVVNYMDVIEFLHLDGGDCNW